MPQKLDRLFDTVRPPNGYGRTYSYAEVAALAEANGGPSISPSYVHALRNDPARRPTRDALQSLAAAFGVSVVYFFDDEIADRLDADLELLVAMRDPEGARRRAAGGRPLGGQLGGDRPDDRPGPGMGGAGAGNPEPTYEGDR